MRVNNESTNPIFKGLSLKGHPADIPDAVRDDLPQFFSDMNYKEGAEIGVYKGEFSKKLLDAGLTLFGVDPWRDSNDYKITKGQEKLDLQYEESKTIFDKYPKSRLIRKTSMEAVEEFADESLDFVYIDGNHEFRYIAEDLVEWTKKVRPGGCVSGDDYFFTKLSKGKQLWHVGHVLKAFTLAYGIENWYVIGSKYAKPGERRDKWRSWMFMKK